MISRRLTIALLALALTGYASATASGIVEPAAGQQEPAQATGEGEHAEEVPHGMPWRDVAFRWVNFVLLAGLLYWMLVVPPPAIQEIFSFPGLKVVLSNRAAQIIEARELAQQQKVEADRILTGSEERLSGIEAEVVGLLSQAREDAEREKDRAEEQGREQAEKLRETARRELRAETLGAQRQLRSFVAELAVGIAEKTLRDNLTAADQQRLVDDYLSRLGGRLA